MKWTSFAQADTLCIDNTTNNYHVTGDVGSSFEWNTNGNGNINSGQGTSFVNITWNTNPGIYSLSVTETNAIGCSGLTQTLAIVVVDYRVQHDVQLCAGESYTLSDGTVVNTSGTYVTVIPTSVGCDSVITTVLNISAPVYVHIHQQDTSLFYGESLRLSADAIGHNSVLWSPPERLDCDDCLTTIASPNVTTTYCITASNSFNCTASDCIEIIMDTTCKDLFIPNVFAPSTGGHKENDCYRIYGGHCVETAK